MTEETVLKKVMWVHPGRSKCLSNIEGGISDESPLRIGTMLRNGDMLGAVLQGREYDGLPIDAQSVLVKCTHALNDKTDLDRVHVWFVPGCQVLEGPLLLAVQTDPMELLFKFQKMEDRLEEERIAEKQQQQQQHMTVKKAKKMPGKKVL